VSGIGPKLAITILSGMPTPDMVGAIRGNDIQRLTKIPGIGKKTAERMVLELRDKLDAFGTTTAPVKTTLPVEEDVMSALENLGYQRAVVQKALAVVAGGKQNFDELFRKTLGVLAK
jgi:holliday junction DNA helicase RuvA